MRLKRDSVLVLFKVLDANTPSIIEAVFASPEAMDRYFANHDLGRRHQLGVDGEVYPKFVTKKFKFYSLEEVTRKKKKPEEAKSIVDEPVPTEEKEDEDTKAAPLEDILDEVDEMLDIL